ncbi:MAG: UDP-N-acetylmuramoyl-L-alanine--D-glutamate ligase [Proteobacteria bacterium]|nr:UDP-N-acetylmuramoyl-L-alanine--D-glutamate ligase [Pseudomonadota bacterium]
MSAATEKTRASAKKALDARHTNLVFGLGITGLSVARYLKRKGIAARFVDTREKPPGLAELGEIDPDADIVLGQLPERLLKNVSRIIVSPGISDAEPLLQAARNAGVEIVSDIQLFVHDAVAPLVAVTGSNGKSTVTTLLSLMCDAAGINGLAGANLGEPALDLLEQDTPAYYILELSSFQLQRTATLPLKVAVLLNISPDHLDWHASEDEYRSAKYRILKEAESAVINRDDEEAPKHLAKDVVRLSFALDAPGEGQFGLVNEDGEEFLARGEQLLLSTADIAMVGVHNQANALAALAAGELMGLELSAMLQVVHEFPGLPHRMQYIARINGADFINDSKATNVSAAVASVESVPGLVVLIAGGQGKGGDFDAFAKSVCSKLRSAVFFGEDAAAIERAFDGLAPTSRVADLHEAVHRAAEIAAAGDTVLLAPACASFDQYQNFEARGDDFRSAVMELTA